MESSKDTKVKSQLFAIESAIAYMLIKLDTALPGIKGAVIKDLQDAARFNATNKKARAEFALNNMANLIEHISKLPPPPKS